MAQSLAGIGLDKVFEVLAHSLTQCNERIPWGVKVKKAVNNFLHARSLELAGLGCKFGETRFRRKKYQSLRILLYLLDPADSIANYFS